MTDEIGLPPHTEGLPPTARLVYRYLQDADRPRTTDELAVWCRCSTRSVRKALVDLDEEDLAETVTNTADLSQPRWRLTDGAA